LTFGKIQKNKWKEFLKSYLGVHKGTSSIFMMRLKPDKKIGMHNLPLKGAVIETPLLPDTVKVPAEVFSYTEKATVWEETIV